MSPVKVYNETALWDIYHHRTFKDADQEWRHADLYIILAPLYKITLQIGLLKMAAVTIQSRCF